MISSALRFSRMPYRECDMMAAALKEWCFQFLIKGSKLTGKGWLGDMKLFGGFCKALLFCYCQEVA